MPTKDVIEFFDKEVLQMHLGTALSVHSNVGGVTHGHLGLLMTNTKYATLSPVGYVRSVQPGILGKKLLMRSR